MKIDFITWHLLPEEEASPEMLGAIVAFCRRNHWSYLFNTEIANYRRDDSRFGHPDGTYRYDLTDQTLTKLHDDPLFLGVIYDEAELMQAMCGVVDEKGKAIKPYFADTRQLSASEAFLAVAAKVSDLKRRYEQYGKRLIFEMVFPDYPFAFARGGGTLAPKLLKENYNDLMYAVYRGAALEYHSDQLWACIDLWFLDKFPWGGRYEPGDHTPGQLLEALQYAYLAGFDSVYVEQAKALLDDRYALTAYGEKMIEFQAWRDKHRGGDWRTAPVSLYVKRFPDGYWGQKYSGFIPDHPYGSWMENPYRPPDVTWFKTLNELSGGAIPIDADTWNAARSPHFVRRPYQALAGVPGLVVFDHFGNIPPHTGAKMLDLTQSGPDRR